MNSVLYNSTAHFVWGRLVIVGRDAIISTIRRLAIIVHPERVFSNISSPRRIVSAQALQWARRTEFDAHSRHSVSYATGFDEFERMLDAHRRDRTETLPRRSLYRVD